MKNLAYNLGVNSIAMVEGVIEELRKHTQVLDTPVKESPIQGKIVCFRTLPYVYYMFAVTTKYELNTCLRLCEKLPDTVLVGGEKHSTRAVVVAYYEDSYQVYSDKIEIMGPNHISSLSALNYFKRPAMPLVRELPKKVPGSNTETLKDMLKALETHNMVTVKELTTLIGKEEKYSQTVKTYAENCFKIVIHRSSIDNPTPRLTLKIREQVVLDHARKSLVQTGLFKEDVVNYLCGVYTGVASFSEEDVQMLDALFNKGCICRNEVRDCGYGDSVKNRLDAFVCSHDFEFDKVVDLLQVQGTVTVTTHIYDLVKTHTIIKATDIADYLGVAVGSLRGYYNMLVTLKAVKKKRLDGKVFLVPIDKDVDIKYSQYENPLVGLESPKFENLQYATSYDMEEYLVSYVHKVSELPPIVVEKLLEVGYVTVEDTDIICKSEYANYMAYKEGQLDIEAKEVELLDKLETQVLTSQELGKLVGVTAKSISPTLIRLVKEGLLRKIEVVKESKKGKNPTKTISYTVVINE